MRKRNLRSVSILICLVFCLAACSDDPYTAAAKATDDVATAVGQATAGTADLYNAGVITKDEKNAVAIVLLNLVDGNTEFRNKVKELHAKPATTKTDYLNAASSFVQSGRNLLASGDLHVKNADGQKKLDLWLQAIQTGLSGVATAIQSAKGS